MFYTEEKLLYPSFIPERLNFQIVGVNLDIPIFIALVKKQIAKADEETGPKLVLASDIKALIKISEGLPIKRIFGLMPKRLTKSQEYGPIEIKQVLCAASTRNPKGVVFQYLLASGESIFDGVTRAPKTIQKLKFESFINCE